jgi:hypothetical protein
MEHPGDEQIALTELIALLRELFDAEQLRRWAHLTLGEELHQALPGTSVSFGTLCYELATKADQRGLINASFFEQLRKERPGKAERIQDVAALWRDGRHAPPPNASRSPGDRESTGVRNPAASTAGAAGAAGTARDSTAKKAASAIELPETLPEPALLPPGSRMPMRRNELFVGREDQLRTLAKTLQAQGTAAIGQIASVTGLGGIGKTQLAAEFVHRYGQFFTGGVFWLSFSDPASVRAELAECGGPENLNLWPIGTAPDFDTQVAWIRRMFAGPEPRLLVFDNCEEEKLLDEWRPKTGGSRVLVTSRRHAFSPQLRVRTLNLDVLPRADALALLHSLNDGQPYDHSGQATLDEICAELGDLPLALHLAGSFLACYRNTITPAAYLTQLRARALLGHTSLQGRGSTSSPTNHDLHVGRTFALSWDRLDPSNAVDAMARDLLQRAACLAPGELIPHEMLVATLGPAQNDLDAALAREDALHRLLHLGLLDAPESGAYRIHRLVTVFAQQAAGDHVVARAAVEQVVLYGANFVNASRLPAQLRPWQPHLRAITDAARDREDEQAVHLCNALGQHLCAIGEYGNARQYFERSLAIAEKQLGPEHPLTGVSLTNRPCCSRQREPTRPLGRCSSALSPLRRNSLDQTIATRQRA